MSQTCASATSAATEMATWELVLVGVVAFLFTSPGMMLLGATDDMTAPDTPLLRLFWPPVYLGVLVLCGRRLPRLASCWAAGGFCAAIVGWAYLSHSWSIFPGLTSRRAVAFGLTTLFGVYLGAVPPGRKLVEILAGTFLLLALGSLVLALLYRKVGVQHDPELEGDWRGLWSHKNALASWMVVGILASVTAASRRGPRRLLWIGTAGLCLFLLVMSKGKTSLASLVVVLGAMGALALMRRGPIATVATIWVAITALVGAGVVLTLYPTALFKALGKDATLTGRTDIWAAVMRQVAHRPWLGYGYGAFWEKPSVPAQIVASEAHWLVPSAHNGWLDLMLQLGGGAVILFAVVLALGLFGAATRRRALDDDAFSLLYLLFFSLLALSESVIEQQNTLLWALFVAAFTRAISPAHQRPPAKIASVPPRPVFQGVPARRLEA